MLQSKFTNSITLGQDKNTLTWCWHTSGKTIITDHGL